MRFDREQFNIDAIEACKEDHFLHLLDDEGSESCLDTLDFSLENIVTKVLRYYSEDQVLFDDLESK